MCNDMYKRKIESKLQKWQKDAFAACLWTHDKSHIALSTSALRKSLRNLEYLKPLALSDGP